MEGEGSWGLVGCSVTESYCKLGVGTAAVWGCRACCSGSGRVGGYNPSGWRTGSSSAVSSFTTPFPSISILNGPSFREPSFPGPSS